MIFRIQVHDFISIDDNFELHGNISFGGLNVNNLIIYDGDIIGDPENLVNGVNLQQLYDCHLSKTQAQIFAEPVHFGTVVLKSGFDANIINGYDFKNAVKHLKHLKSNEEMLKQPQVFVDQMFINGAVHFDRLNGFDIEYSKKNAIRLDQTNNIDFPVVFNSPVDVNGNMYVEEMNGENLNDFINDLVRKSANNTRIYGTTIFEEDVTVLQDVHVTTINNKPVDSILTRNHNREIVQPIEIHGNVFIPNLIVDGELNGVNADELNTYSYDESTYTHYLKKDVVFNQSIQVKYLNLLGGYNQIENVPEYLKEIIRTDRPAVINGTIRFTGSVHFENDIDIIEYNEVNVPNFLSNIIMIDQYEPVDIYTNVVFQAPVTIPDLTILGNLTTSTINNCSVVDWIEKSIRTDQPYTFEEPITFPDGTVEAANINTKYLNGFPMDDILTLNTPQNFSRPVRFGEVYSSGHFITNGLVSGYDLKKERENTLMVCWFLFY